MENKNQSSLIILVVLLAVIFVGLLSFYFFNKSGNKSMETAQDNSSLVQTTDNTVQRPQKGDLDYQEPQTRIEIGTQGVSKGNFEKIEGENIFFRSSENILTQFPLTSDEIAVSCTSQDLAGATELDYNQVKEVKITTPAGLSSMIPVDEFIVVFAQVVDGVNRVHTIALDAAKCTTPEVN